MLSKKLRLHVALYARGGGPRTAQLENSYAEYYWTEHTRLTAYACIRYHWALIIGPKNEADESIQGLRLHVRNRPTPLGNIQWIFEALSVPLRATNMLLVRITIAEIADLDRTLEVLRAVPVRQDSLGWTCKSWVEEAVASLDLDAKALGEKRAMSWEKVHAKAVEYCDDKRAANRFDGQGNFDAERPPTWSLIKGKELIP